MPSDETLDVWRSRLTSVEVAAVAGIVCALAWTVSLRGLLLTPTVAASQQEISAFYARSDATPSLGWNLALVTVGTVGFLWFTGVVRDRLGRMERRLVDTVFVSGSVVMACLVLVGASAIAAPAFLLEVGGQQPDPGAAALFRSFGVVVLSVFTPRVATLIMFSVASLARQADALPRWLILTTYVVGIIEFVNVTVSTPVIYVFPAWIALVSAVALVRHDRFDAARNGQPSAA